MVNMGIDHVNVGHHKSDISPKLLGCHGALCPWSKKTAYFTNIRDSHKMSVAEVLFWAFGQMFPDTYKAVFAKYI